MFSRSGTLAGLVASTYGYLTRLIQALTDSKSRRLIAVLEMLGANLAQKIEHKFIA